MAYADDDEFVDHYILEELADLMGFDYGNFPNISPESGTFSVEKHLFRMKDDRFLRYGAVFSGTGHWPHKRAARQLQDLVLNFCVDSELFG